MKESVPRKPQALAPHCDPGILHKPGSCQFCDHYPEYQQARQLWGINFTGQYDEDKLCCPSEVNRVIEDIEKWGGNRADPT